MCLFQRSNGDTLVFFFMWYVGTINCYFLHTRLPNRRSVYIYFRQMYTVYTILLGSYVSHFVLGPPPQTTIDRKGFTLGGAERTLRGREGTRTHGDCEYPSTPPPLNDGTPTRRLQEIMRKEYGSFFEGMTPSARELYQVCL